jgi:hypothetical protein
MKITLFKKFLLIYTFMNKILKYKDWEKNSKIIEEFARQLINPKMNESINETTIKSILTQLARDLKFNYQLIFTFGAGINAMYPIILHLIKNSNLNVDLTTETVVLMTIAAISIAYLEENKNKSGDAEIICKICDGSGLLPSPEAQSLDDVDNKENCHSCAGKGSSLSLVTRKDAQTMLEELKMKGVGNRVVEKLVKCLTSIGSFLKMIFKNTPIVISSLIDLFGYTAILIPTMNAISSIINQNFWNVENLPNVISSNLISVGVGIVAFLAKRGFDNLANKIKDFIGKNWRKKVNINQVDKNWDVKNLSDHEIINEWEK